MALVTPPHLSPGSTDSAGNAWDHDAHLVPTQTRTKKETVAFLVSQLNQVTLK